MSETAIIKMYSDYKSPYAFLAFEPAYALEERYNVRIKWRPFQLRLKGKGLPVLQGYGQGDLMVHINIWTPKQVSKEEKEILEKLRESENFKPTPDHNDKGFFQRMKDMFQ